MARIKPFKGVRPDPHKVREVTSPPYDVLNSDEARIMADGNPYSFLHVVKPEIDLPKGVDPYDERVYRKGKENFNNLLAEGILIQDDKPCYYLYKLQMNGIVETGLVVGASVEDYENEIIKKHEYTRAAKEADRIKHVETLNANTGPVFLTFKAKKEIEDFFNEVQKKPPVYDFMKEDGVVHKFWIIDNDDDIKKITELFAGVDSLYIADGHHRAASAAKVGEKRRANNPNHTGEEEYNWFLAVIFPHNHLHIMDYNRVVKDLNNHTKEEFIEKVKENFTVEECAENKPYKPDQKHRFGMYLDGKWYKLEAKEGSFDENDLVASLDVSILQNNLLTPILGIGDPRKDKRIDFVGGIRGLYELEKRVNAGEAVAFSLFPTSIEDLMKIADAHKVMPPKSTWFEPKLLSGLIVHLLD